MDGHDREDRAIEAWCTVVSQVEGVPVRILAWVDLTGRLQAKVDVTRFAEPRHRRGRVRSGERWLELG